MIIDPAWAANEDLRDGTIQFLQYVRASFAVSQVLIITVLLSSKVILFIGPYTTEFSLNINWCFYVHVFENLLH